MKIAGTATNRHIYTYSVMYLNGPQLIYSRRCTLRPLMLYGLLSIYCPKEETIIGTTLNIAHLVSEGHSCSDL